MPCNVITACLHSCDHQPRFIEQRACNGTEALRSRAQGPRKGRAECTTSQYMTGLGSKHQTRAAWASARPLQRQRATACNTEPTRNSTTSGGANNAERARAAS
eukprot:15466389-Alexandrium_andersonii.AAC.1